MSITIGLSAYFDGDPPQGFVWDVDFEQGVPVIALSSDPADFPLSQFTDGAPPFSTGLHWGVLISPELADSSLAGMPVSDLLSDGDSIYGSFYDDRLLLTSNDDIADGGNGDDIIEGRAGDDYLIGYAGEDYLDGGPGADILRGEDSDDTYRIDAFNMIIEFDNYGTDTVEADFSYHLESVEIENIRLVGTANVDAVGNGVNNSLWGNGGNNHLFGNGGIDRLDGRPGDDHIFGGPRRDVATGGEGADAFCFESVGKMHFDLVKDFSRKEGDQIELMRSVVSNLKNIGILKKSYFDAGNARAEDRDDYLLYNKDTGLLLYDSDGSGKGSAVKIAVLDGAPKLKAGDIEVV